MTPVGIDAIEIWTGKLELDLAETFAPAMDADPEKYTRGLGLFHSSFPDAYEDIVTMGANAAHRLMERKGLTPTDIGRIDVATESAFDNSKPVSTYIAGCLEDVYREDFHHANKGERKFACIAGTQSIDDAYNWIRAGRSRGKGALVIATDTALYTRGDPGEATQGAGAVAIYMCENPNLVELSVEQGYGSADETDFLKPNQQFPSVDGKRSMQVFLMRMREALADFETVAGDTHPDDYLAVPFHTPFPGMVRKAAALGYRHMIRDTDVEERLATEIGRQPRRHEFESREAFDDATREYVEELCETQSYQSWYDESIEPTMDISRQVGNWYTGSVHVARASALRAIADDGVDATGKQLLVASYGSGAQAEIHEETIVEGWREEIAALNIDSQIEARHDISFAEYERVHDRHNHEKGRDLEAFTEPATEFAFSGIGPMDERQYEYVE